MSPLGPERVTALVPCHRAPPAGALLEGLAAAVGRVLVVDDGMPAEGRTRLVGMLDGAVTALHLARNRGKGFAVSAGVEHLLAGADPPEAVLVMDADGQHPVRAVRAFLRAGERAELVIGDRLADAATMPRVRRLANRSSSLLLAAVTGRPVRDGQCGMRLMRGRALHDIPFPPGGYESETAHLKRCLRAGVPVAWVPIPAIYEGAPSSFRAVRDSVRVVAAAVR